MEKKDLIVLTVTGTLLMFLIAILSYGEGYKAGQKEVKSRLSADVNVLLDLQEYKLLDKIDAMYVRTTEDFENLIKYKHFVLKEYEK